MVCPPLDGGGRRRIEVTRTIPSFRMPFFKLWLAGIPLLGIVSCRAPKPGVVSSSDTENLIPYTVTQELPHDRKAYTQGLVYYQGKVYEGTGSENSWLAVVNLESGEQDKKVVLDKEYFGEGITVLNDKIYQLTWKDKKGFIYDAKTFEKLGTFQYNFEGWGLTTDGQHLIISDGTSSLYYLDTLNFEVQKILEIREKGSPVKDINELEYIDGYIFANQYQTDYVLKIDPEKEEVVGKLDLTAIAGKVKRRYRNANVLNGIAWNPETGEILITGKYWPRAYLIQVHD